MKLDKIKFARLIGLFASRCDYVFNETDIRDLDDLIDIDVPEPDVIHPARPSPKPNAWTKNDLRKIWHHKPMQQDESDAILKFIEELEVD